MRYTFAVLLVLGLTKAGLPQQSVSFRSVEPIAAGTEQIAERAHVLLDVIGPRLTGSPGHVAAMRWLAAWYDTIDVAATIEPYGTAPLWSRGEFSIGLVYPRLQSIRGTTAPWSAASTTREGNVLDLPIARGQDDFTEWLPKVRGNFVLVSPYEPSCRDLPVRDSTTAARYAERDSIHAHWSASVEKTGRSWEGVLSAIDSAGAAGIVISQWSRGWGAHRVHRAPVFNIPAFSITCEDYGLLHRLANRGGARIRAGSSVSSNGDTQVSNVIAKLEGRPLPRQYVMLSAHLDSWDAGTGATDNGAGTLVVMEAMRILRTVLPNPRRTIIAAHWGGEEQGLLGSRAWAEDNPEVVRDMQILLNIDRGTGSLTGIDLKSFTAMQPKLNKWLAMGGIEKDDFRVRVSGDPAGNGSDDSSFSCKGAPAFYLDQIPSDYGRYTWHSNLDTFDKLNFHVLREAAITLAVIAFHASEDPDILPYPTTGDRVRSTCPPATRVYR